MVGKHLFLVGIWSLVGIHSLAQASFEVFSDANQVFHDGYLEVTFSLKNAEGSGFQPPAFQDFTVLSGPSRSISTTVINGRMSKEVSYRYTIQPRRTGTLTIGAATINVGGTTMQTKPLRIDVIERDASERGGRDYFVEVVPSTDDAFVGQQIRLDYRLYTKVEIQNYNIVEEPDYAGFYAEDIRRPDTRLRREIVEGEQYFTRNLKSVALYPQQAGRITIPPAVIQLGVVTGEQDSYSLFFGNNIKRVPFRTDSLAIEVRALPKPAPKGFTGAVGRFRLRTSANRTTLTTDDALSVVMEISGNGDLKRIQPPDPDLPPVFDQYDPEIDEYDLGELNGFQQGQKVFTFLAQPREAGVFSISPRFVYFDPDSAVYQTLMGDTLDLTIRQGIMSANAPEVVDDLIDEGSDLGDLRLNTKLKKGKPVFFVASGWYWSVTGLPLALFLGLLVYRNRQKSEEAIDPQERKKREAQAMAAKRLEQARAYQQAGESRAFYDEVSKAMLHYVSDKLQIERASLSKHNVRARLRELGVDEAKVDDFTHMLETCETALYANMDKADAIQGIYQQAVDMLALVEQQIRVQR